MAIPTLDPQVDHAFIEWRKQQLADESRAYYHDNEDYAAQRRAQVRDRKAKNREVIDAYKLERGCADCGYAEHPCALDFDHRPGEEKRFEIGSSMSYALDTLFDEIAKCDVVCANHHRIRTAQRAGRF